MEIKNKKIGVIGLGYVGLPLAIEFSKKYEVVGFDNSPERIENLKRGFDETREIEPSILKKVLKKNKGSVNGLKLSGSENILGSLNVYIVTVPTPVDKANQPDLSFLSSATASLGKVLKKGDVVIYESTTYPGCTEEYCVPLLEKKSGLRFNYDFYCGYSPERINPGDRNNTLTSIKKLTSGSTPEIAVFVDELYGSIITAGTHMTSSIRVAEAAKAIENAQRDLCISFTNELALIFDRMDIDTHEVLEAAATKWNFIKSKPGLVGGHCIGVDPYYLSYKAQTLGYHPDVILSGRRVNDRIGSFVAHKLVKIMISKGLRIKRAKVLILGITFKENCPDIRNTRIIDIRKELLNYGCEVDICDPWASNEEVKKLYDFEIISDISIDLKFYSGIILGVGHDIFKELPFQANDKLAVYDVKGFLDKDKIDARL